MLFSSTESVEMKLATNCLCKNVTMIEMPVDITLRLDFNKIWRENLDKASHKHDHKNFLTQRQKQYKGLVGPVSFEIN